MQPFPHEYAVSASATPSGDIELISSGLPPLATASPAEFDGPGDRWSPETLLVGAIADCYILTFRAIAKASKLSWTSLDCQVNGRLERIERVTRFTAFTLRAVLEVPDGVDEAQARRLLAKAEETCLVTRSLNAPVHLEVEVTEGVGLKA